MLVGKVSGCNANRSLSANQAVRADKECLAITRQAIQNRSNEVTKTEIVKRELPVKGTKTIPNEVRLFAAALES
jgi:hypothetical protein